MRIGNKGPIYSDECVKWLDKLSKAALIDCVVDLLRCVSSQPSCDEPVAVDAARIRLAQVLIDRGDKVPK